MQSSHGPMAAGLRVLWPSISLIVGVAVFALAFTELSGAQRDEAKPADVEAQAPAVSEQLHYIGRDPVTGMASRVNAGFIAEHEEAIERYGQDAREPVAPPRRRGPEPQVLRIDALDIAHETARYGLDAYGRLDVPQDATSIGWHPAYSAVPGDDGSTFLAAHYEYRGEPGVFFELADLQEGDLVFVELDDGSEHRYRVTSTVDYDLGVVDMGALLRGREGVESVILMTCSGPVLDGIYQWRTVVLAERVEG